MLLKLIAAFMMLVTVLSIASGMMSIMHFVKRMKHDGPKEY